MINGEFNIYVFAICVILLLITGLLAWGYSRVDWNGKKLRELDERLMKKLGWVWVAVVVVQLLANIQALTNWLSG